MTDELRLSHHGGAEEGEKALGDQRQHILEALRVEAALNGSGHSHWMQLPPTMMTVSVCATADDRQEQVC